MTPTPDSNTGCAIFPNGLSAIVAVVLGIAYWRWHEREDA